MRPGAHTRPPGEPFRLAEIDPKETGKLRGKDDARELLEANRKRLQDLQQCLHAQGRHALLIVLQGMDASGKDGVIRHVMGAFDPQGVEVTSFKVPTPEELAHDFLWRIHRAVPGRGRVGIFNRSHYEDVVVVRVKELVPKEVWGARYEAINRFERLLADHGVTLVKIFLHLSPAEQAAQLAERQREPDKQWKFSPGDLAERGRWPLYMEAWDDALTLCNTAWAPWHVIPADHKWYRNLVASQVVLDALGRLDLAYPEPPENIGSYVIPEVRWP
jgi:PPK2 family polyphosphate:nucleotide phosphotransferase